MGAVQVPVVLEQVLDTIQIVADDPQRQSPPVDTNPSAEQAIKRLCKYHRMLGKQE